ncbi:hypothetical protein [Endozoicomonas sp. SESOKO2]|uniref:hypothetical protein n=1 Tax=Endozoicomonas sp. SESOKO2 TaxID=2828743 RepID=UPI002148E438|nr:hypothetical protein [Endozoicomonas sp. SESOKO2]
MFFAEFKNCRRSAPQSAQVHFPIRKPALAFGLLDGVLEQAWVSAGGSHAVSATR